MKLPKTRHRWDLTPKQAIRLQARLAAEVLQTPLRRSPRFVAGGDAAISDDRMNMIAGWVVWDVETRRTLEESIVIRPVRFPYVPGLLSFREAPALLAAARKLEIEPDVFMLDGQGFAHPRRFGLACHVGLLLDRPSLGCAKSRLCGEHGAVGDAAGARAPLTDDRGAIGCVLRTRPGVKPVYVSIGHRITLDDAIRVTLLCCTKYRLPEPARLAHQLVSRVRLKQ